MTVSTPTGLANKAARRMEMPIIVATIGRVTCEVKELVPLGWQVLRLCVKTRVGEDGEGSGQGGLWFVFLFMCARTDYVSGHRSTIEPVRFQNMSAFSGAAHRTYSHQASAA